MLACLGRAGPARKRLPKPAVKKKIHQAREGADGMCLKRKKSRPNGRVPRQMRGGTSRNQRKDFRKRVSEWRPRLEEEEQGEKIGRREGGDR